MAATLKWWEYDSPDEGERVCVQCGRAQPLADFDQRFIGKPCNLTCASCRRERDVAAQAEAFAEWVRWVCAEARRVGEREERERAREERERLYRARAVALGFDEFEQDQICYIHERLARSALSWDEIKQRFLALTPTVVRRADWKPKRSIPTSVKHAIYVAQEGRCTYCERPIIVAGEPEVVSCLCATCHNRRGGGDYTTGQFANSHCLRGQVDHKTPRARGGGDEIENLCYACAGCNRAKMMLTVEEFAQYPNDAFTQVPVGAWLMAIAVDMEARGYDGFGQG